MKVIKSKVERVFDVILARFWLEEIPEQSRKYSIALKIKLEILEIDVNCRFDKLAFDDNKFIIVVSTSDLEKGKLVARYLDSLYDQYC